MGGGGPAGGVGDGERPVRVAHLGGGAEAVGVRGHRKEEDSHQGEGGRAPDLAGGSPHRTSQRRSPTTVAAWGEAPVSSMGSTFRLVSSMAATPVREGITQRSAS